MTLVGLRDAGFSLHFSSHAEAILASDFGGLADELEQALLAVSIPITEIVGSGGGEALLTQRLRRTFANLGWNKRNVEIKKIVDGVERESISHEIDHFHATPSGTFALEIEWNNKDPFFDRDLENFKRLHAEGVVSVGAIVTRGPDMQQMLRDLVAGWAHREGIRSFDDLKHRGFKRPTERQEQLVALRVNKGEPFDSAWAAMFTLDKYGAATTHWSKLMDRVSRGVGNPCPLILIGLPTNRITMNA
jgi:Restriction endonuclease BglII